VFSQFTGTNKVINNGNMRFGDGTELSITVSGTLKQPFYLSSDNGWRQLTYTDIRFAPPNKYPLDCTFGVGGNGTDEWNINGVMISNPILTLTVFDSSGFNISGGIGTGVIKVKGEITVGTSQLEIINTYSIGAGDNFIKVTTSIENIGATAITNLRYWVGTRDDYVGGTDEPIKERGNLVGGSFQKLTTITERSSALRILTVDEGILFFTKSTNSNTSVADFDFVYNVSETVTPSTVSITTTNDGSYSLYVRLQDIAVGESDSFIWYYAASALDELGDVIKDVADASCPTCIKDTDDDGILDPDDICPYAPGVSILNGCPWSVNVSNNYKSTTVSNSVEIADELFICSLINPNYYNIAYHTGTSEEPVIGNFIIYNNSYPSPHSLLNDNKGFAFMKLRDYNKIIEVRKSDGEIVAIYTCN
tara:strand:+ start:11263 stop:12525 length:1263 start_codon:yes stop_codon:yes gene_type:complete